MKNERCLIKKDVKFNEKMIKMCMIFIGFLFLTGFYDERNIYVDLEEITVELGHNLNDSVFDHIYEHLNNSNFDLENSVPQNEAGEAIKVGTYNYYIVYRDEERKYSRLTNKRSTISVIDTIKPEIELKETSLKFEYGSKINVNDIALCYDLSKCTLSFKDTINTKKSGTHEVVILAIDENNNINEKNISIKIKEKPKNIYSSHYMNVYNEELNNNLTYNEKNSLRYELIAYAKLFEGNPYVYGGNSLTNGTDCSGFVKGVYSKFGYIMPRSAISQSYIGIEVSRSELLPGDIVAYRYSNSSGHVGIYIGNGMMIHAGTEKTGIIIAPIFSGNKTYRRIIY